MNFAGIKEDCESLLGFFQATDTVRFEEFLSIWQGLKFHTIFYGGMRSLESIRFTREVLSVASTYFLPPYTFQIRVGAMYLLYGLYNTQLCQPKQKIRLSLKDWVDVEHLHQELISAQHLDAVYIFRQMRRMRAFYFTAMPTMLTFKSQKSIQLEVSKEEFLEKKDRVADLITSESLEEIMNIQEHYQKTKCNLSSGKSQPNKTLNLIKEDFTDSLQSLVEGYQFWKQEKRAPRTNTDDEQEGTSQESEGSERARHLAQIKSKTYSAVTQAVKSRRHRQVEMLTSSAEAGVCLPVTRAERTRLSRARKRAEREAAKKAQTPLPQRKSEKMPVIPEEDSSSSSEDVPASKRQRKDEDSPSWMPSGYS
ncbi:snRNA-activating protein complex subunit 1-like isoform X4 [Ranitomeya variabilis]|uniref:snRNA-activating protein complex subunit 1-like isoform X4 n=1 Tax=Ranitomeya variabilis TaxID=490064 RepID=UPI004056FE64